MLLNVHFSSTNMRMDTFFENLQEVTIRENNVSPYTGEYTVTPKIHEQTLLTAQKLMTENVMIQAIPYFETSNSSGGKTIYIGMEVNSWQ